jgi:hypothetical protein
MSDQASLTLTGEKKGPGFWARLKRRLHIQSRPLLPREHGALPGYGQVYLDHLIGEFESLKAVCKNEEAANSAQKIVDRAADEMMTWGDAYALDEEIAGMLPVEYLHQRAWCLEARYRDAVGKADAYDAFMKLEAKHLVEETEEHLRARVHNMIRELYRLYTVIACREEMREKISHDARRTLLWIVAIVAIGVLFLRWLARARLDLECWTWSAGLGVLDLWFLVFGTGATGSLISMQRRLQSLPNHGESLSDLVEMSGSRTLMFTPFVGGVFAVALLMIFCSGMLKEDIFPAFTPSKEGSHFIEFATNLIPKNTEQWGKILVWSFIAGFAERFVPDTLDRLIARSEHGKQGAK